MPYEEVKRHLEKSIYPFHIPGHKRNPEFLPENLLNLDLTELPGLDVLSNPKKTLKEMQRKLAEFHDAKQSFLLVNGSTAGITAAILATVKEGDTLVVPRNAHQSVYNALVLSGGVPHYILPEISQDGLPCGVTPEAFKHMPEGATAIVVSPTYEGFISDIAGIAKVVKEKKGKLIVDAAHGAHFKFIERAINSDKLLSVMVPDHHPDTTKGPQSLEGKYILHQQDLLPLQQGADIVIESLHKTLPMLGQTAVVHLSKNSQVDPARLQFMVNTMQTSSPSYAMMATADFVMDKLRANPILFTSYIWRLDNLRENLNTLSKASSIRLKGSELIGRHGIHGLDPSKLLIHYPTQPGDLRLAQHVLAEVDGIGLEMAAYNHLLAVTTVADTLEGFQLFEKAMARLQQVHEDFTPNPEIAPPIQLPEVVLTPREAMQQDAVDMYWKDAVGSISAQIISKTPPGIALVAPGERIPELPPGLFVDTPFLKNTIRIIPNL